MILQNESRFHYDSLLYGPEGKIRELGFNSLSLESGHAFLPPGMEI